MIFLLQIGHFIYVLFTHITICTSRAYTSDRLTLWALWRFSFSGSVCNVSGTNSDEGDTSDDQNEYKKVSNNSHNYNNKNTFSGSNQHNNFPSKPLAQVISHNKNNENNRYQQNEKNNMYKTSESDFEYKNEKNEAPAISHDEALLSMMSFFSHCHQVESEKEI